MRVVDHLEFYLLNYFKPGHYIQNTITDKGRAVFSPDDTASNLDPADPTKPNFPQFGHGSIKLTVLFNDPSDPE